MKAKRIVPLLMFTLVLWGCDGPETVVTNYVHADGSVTRRVEMRSTEEVVEPESCKVPVDSTWITVTSMEVSDKGDTTWVIVAEKTFPCADSINAAYSSGKDMNFMAKRAAFFYKSFRWFSTVYTFTEKIERLIPYGYPINDYLVGEGREFFLLPQSVADELMKGQDSSKYLIASDSAGHQIDRWVTASLLSGWFSEAALLLNEAGADSVEIADFCNKEKEVLESGDDFMSLDSILPVVLGKDFTSEYTAIFDSAENKIEKDLEVFMSFEGYTMKTMMPGKLIGGNGYFTNSGEVAWPVKPELFLCEDYLMQAESRIINVPVCILSGLFVILVVAGYAYRRHNRG
jgi:hypothetical protein